MNDYLAKAFVVFLLLGYTALTLVMIFVALKWWVWPRLKRRLPQRTSNPSRSPSVRQQHQPH